MTAAVQPILIVWGGNGALPVLPSFPGSRVRTPPMSEAEPQLRELGAALRDPRLKGSNISIGGHTDAIGGDAFNQRLSERRAATIKWYLVDNFRLPPANLHAVGYGRQRPKNKADLFAPENRRVEIVNETTRTQAQR